VWALMKMLNVILKVMLVKDNRQDYHSFGDITLKLCNETKT
jgi:hypothetical protein